MQANLKIATPDDLSLLVELNQHFQTFFQENYDPVKIRQTFQTLLADATLGRVWLIRWDEELVGYLVFTLGFSIEFGGRTAFIDELFLEEGYRQRGIGNEILNAVIELGKQEGLNVLFLEVNKTNLPAQRLYQKVGFKEWDYFLLARLLND